MLLKCMLGRCDWIEVAWDLLAEASVVTVLTI